MLNSDQQTEEAIIAKGLTAPRITPESLEAKIVAEAYHVFPGTTVTVCMLSLENGFSVVGESAAVSVANFDADIGCQVARRRARDKMWSLEGYLLREHLHQREA